MIDSIGKLAGNQIRLNWNSFEFDWFLAVAGDVESSISGEKTVWPHLALPSKRPESGFAD